jgi:hypothetical protein
VVDVGDSDPARHRRAEALRACCQDVVVAR